MSVQNDEDKQDADNTARLELAAQKKKILRYKWGTTLPVFFGIVSKDGDNRMRSLKETERHSIKRG